MNWEQWLSRPWWTYEPSTATVWDQLYRGFNLFEAGCWFVLAGLVLHRWMRHRRSGTEWVYALVFVLFGLTDVREAWEQSAGLVLVKGIVLVVLLVLRRQVMQRCYPAARVY